MKSPEKEIQMLKTHFMLEIENGRLTPLETPPTKLKPYFVPYYYPQLKSPQKFVTPLSAAISYGSEFVSAYEEANASLDELGACFHWHVQ